MKYKVILESNINFMIKRCSNTCRLTHRNKYNKSKWQGLEYMKIGIINIILMFKSLCDYLPISFFKFFYQLLNNSSMWNEPDINIIMMRSYMISTLLNVIQELPNLILKTNLWHKIIIFTKIQTEVQRSYLTCPRL